ncbi:hypothetical protein QW180_28855 [Vibrio sinaloensis]|nr:hypothetical protein [Vibrio sinaloensis]
MRLNNLASLNRKTWLPLACEKNTKIAHFAENLAQFLGCIESEDFANKDLYMAALEKKS